MTYRTRDALPPDSQVLVALEDVSRGDAHATVVAKQTIATGGRQVPIPFTLRYDPAQIDPAHRYAIRAEIRGSDGTPMFTSTKAQPVLTRGSPTHVDVTLQSASGSSSPTGTIELIETYWKIVSVDGADITVEPNTPEPHLVLKSKDRALEASTGVNRLGGTYELRGGTALTLRPGGMTLMAGSEAMMRQEQVILERLRQVDGYRLEGDRMMLTSQGADVIVLRAVSSK